MPKTQPRTRLRIACERLAGVVACQAAGPWRSPAMLARRANPRVTLAVYAGLTDGAREVAVDKLLNAGFGA